MKFTRTSSLTFEDLRFANVQRNKEWDPEGKIGALFKAVELIGEIGEAYNVIKKLEREKMGLRGSRSSIDNLILEMGDAQVCLDLLAMHYSIDLGEAARFVFNSKSSEMGFLTMLERK
jgi:hypothetical protein